VLDLFLHEKLDNKLYMKMLLGQADCTSRWPRSFHEAGRPRSARIPVVTRALGEVEAAEADFDAAESIHLRAKAPLWVEHTRRARAAL
jgi:hypothetical protein